MRDAEKVFKGFTQEELQAAFDKVADPKDWRAPIDAIIDAETFAEWQVTVAAVEFFTGAAPTSLKAVPPAEAGGKRRIWVQAAGYRNGPCGP